MSKTNIPHFAVLNAVALTAVGMASCTEAPKQADSRPNIIHIMTDDHSIQTLSAYGHPLSKLAPTPNLDRLAAEGMLFTQSFVDNSISAPSRATLLSGLYSCDHGQMTLDKGFDTTKVQFPELLHSAGYQTAIIGKWHLQDMPKAASFDYYKVLVDQGDYYNPEFRTADSDGKYVREDGYATTLITDHSIDWIENRDPSRPFCLLLHHKAPHRNWMPEPQYVSLYEDVTFPEPTTLFDDYSTRGSAASSQEMTIAKFMTMAYDLKVGEIDDPNDPKWTQEEWKRALARMTPEQAKAWHDAYDTRNAEFLAQNLKGDDLTRWKYQRYIKDYVRCIKSIDDQVGRLLDYLDKEGLAENTVIVYTSDQGFYMGEHGWFDKRFMYEESLRMPLIIRYPKSVKAGQVNADLIQNIDFAPTYLDFAGIEAPASMVGLSFKPVAEGSTPTDWRTSIFYHYFDYPAIHQVRRHYGVRTDRYKLIHFYGEGFGKDSGNNADYYELYDLQADPTEVANLYGKAEMADVQADLVSKLEGYRQQLKMQE